MDQEHFEQQENISIRTKHLQKCKKKTRTNIFLNAANAQNDVIR